MRLIKLTVSCIALLGIVLFVVGGRAITAATMQTNEIPVFQYDPTWPKQLPNNWILGNIGAMAVDGRDHIWVIQRPGSTTGLSERYGSDGLGECCFPAPPVMEFDTAGNLLQAWGPIHDDKGKLLGKQTWGPHPEIDWPLSEHGIYVDPKDNVWVDSNTAPSQVLKFTRDGKFLMRLGTVQAKSINDTANFAGPTGILVDPKANEVYIADGYFNRRVIVLDADTGAYKRHWGAYGTRPPDGPQGTTPVEGEYNPDGPPSRQFATVHCIMQSKDGLLYVCDRVNNRIQVFKTDGTFVNEVIVAHSKGFGAAHAIGFSPDKDQRFVYLADGANKKVWIIRRDQMKVVGSFGTGGRNGGQLLIAHALAVDAAGNVYVGETIDNNRVQRFKFMGMKPAPGL
jgi:DNA-binding beta-propeller fold protein YncE